ncbi:uncharacterized protein [Halyomorpha halys]|uniref:uncharacterized protein isoform X2 n=1 Tax=Halyomorpha halys TaxID=286706 RepID=UPI0006D527A4|nr:uncharacterized protein LOC106677737 isoform X2 [Halyomorpha halys]
MIYPLTGPTAKSRWKNLRDNFRRELRRSSIGFHGTAAEEYNSSWRYFNSMFFVKDQLRQNNIISPLAMSRAQNRLDAKDDPSSSVLPNGEVDDVEIVETTHDAFVKEFPKPSCSSSSSKSTTTKSEGEDLQKHMAAAMLASIDPDVGFLASLLPHMRSVSAEKKALLKNHMLQVVLQYSDNEEIDDKVSDCDDYNSYSGSEEPEASNVNNNESASVSTNKRKLLIVQDSGAKKTAPDDSVVIEV